MDTTRYRTASLLQRKWRCLDGVDFVLDDFACVPAPGSLLGTVPLMAFDNPFRTRDGSLLLVYLSARVRPQSGQLR
jgi:hypothetical protein